MSNIFIGLKKTFLDVLDRGDRDQDIETGLKEGIVIEMSTTVLHSRCSLLRLNTCKLALQAPRNECHLDPKTFAGKRIVTSFPNLAKAYMDQYDQELGVTTSIQYVSGSVEAPWLLLLANSQRVATTVVSDVESAKNNPKSTHSCIATSNSSTFALFINIPIPPSKYPALSWMTRLLFVHENLQTPLLLLQNPLHKERLLHTLNCRRCIWI